MRPLLTEDDEREDRDGFEKLRATEAKLRELRSRRDALLTQVHALSDQQKALFDARQPQQQRLEQTHDEHREMGHQLAEVRRQRDDARRRLDEAVAAARMQRPVGARGTPPPARPEQIERELAVLARRQETTALPLSEENALIDHMRALRKQLEAAQRDASVLKEQQDAQRAKDEAVRAAHAEVQRLSDELTRVKVARDRLMESMRAQLLQVGQLVAQVREKARERGLVMERLDALMADVRKLEREADGLVAASRQRRHEARRTVLDHNREVRDRTAGRRESADRNADAQLEELLKRGRITL